MMRCLGCGYDLHGLPENRCPECGRPFNPDNSATFLCSQVDGRKYLTLALSGLFGMTAPIMVARLLGSSSAGQAVECAVIAVFPIGLLTTAVALGVSIRRLRQPPAATVHRNALVAALLVSLLPYAVFVGSAALAVLAVIIDRLLA
jgi:hypothetical protein